MIVAGRVGAALLEISVESCPCGLMHGHETSLSELGLSDHEAVRGDVVKPQPDRLGYSKTRARQQRKERAVGCPAERGRPGLGGRMDELPDLLRREDVRSWPWRLFRTKDRAGHLVAWIFCVEIAREPDDGSEPAGALGNLACQSGPLSRQVGGHVILVSCL
jgi:hypothetical protein